MTLAPFTKTSVDRASELTLNATRTESIQIVAPSAETLTVGQVYHFTSRAEALAVVGTDYSSGNYAPLIIEELYKVQDKWDIYYACPGKNTESVTTTTSTNAIVPGDTKITLTSATGFSVGNYINFGSGATQEYRKILALSGSDVTVNALSFSHAIGEDVVKVTAFDVANLATCRTALASKPGRLYIEDSYGSTQTSALKTYLNARESNELFTHAVVGYPFGTSQATAKSEATAINSKRISQVYGLVELQDKGIVCDGVMTAVKLIAQLGAKKASQRVRNSAVVSMNSIAITNCSDVVSNDTSSTMSKTELTALVNSNVSCLFNQTVDTVNAIRVYKMVTTYNLDESSLPSTTYSNIVDILAEDFMREDIIIKYDNFAGRLAIEGNDLTDKDGDLVKVQAFCQGVIDSYSFLDEEAYNPTVAVARVSTGSIQVTIAYQTVVSADQVSFVFAKQVR